MAMGKINDQHPDYRANRLIWQRIRDVVGGEDPVKARCVLTAGGSPRMDGTTMGAASLTAQLGDYLPKLEGQTLNEYISYLNRAVFYGATGRTVDGLVGAVFRNDPMIALTTALEMLRDDADQGGTPLAIFIKAAFREVITMGRYGVLVDFQDQGALPYLCGYIAESILNWKTDRVGGRMMTTRVVLQESYYMPAGEFGEIERCQYRLHELVDGVYRVRLFQHAAGTDGTDKADEIVENVDAMVVPTINQKPMTQIPFVFLGPTGLGADVQKSPILDLVNMNLHHFRLTAERNNGLFVCSMPQPVIIGDVTRGTVNPGERRIGPGVVLELPVGADAKYLEFAGAGIGAVKEEQDDTEARMVLLGARLLEPQKRAAETAEALRLRQAGDSATLATAADTSSWGFSVALGYAAEWMGEDPAKNYATLSEEFSDAPMSEDDANKLVTRWQNGGATQDDAFYLLKQGGRIEPEITAEEWKRKLQDQAPIAAMPTPAPGGPAATGGQQG